MSILDWIVVEKVRFEMSRGEIVGAEVFRTGGTSLNAGDTNVHRQNYGLHQDNRINSTSESVSGMASKHRREASERGMVGQHCGRR